MTTIVTHNGNYHCDDIFAVATLCLFLGEDVPVEIIRTRDEDIIKKADFVVDVGGYYDENKKVFDHHQNGGAGKRDNGVPYASFGLVWKEYSYELCGDEDVVEELDRKIVQFIDAEDNGVKISKNLFDNIDVYSIHEFFLSFSPTWDEEDVDIDSIFNKCVYIAKEVLKREIKIIKDNKKAEKFVKESYENSKDKRVVVLDRYYPWKDLLTSFSEPLLVIYPSFENSSWHVQAVPKEANIFESRLSFPQSWAGKRDSELVEATGVKDALFCHNKVFLAVAGSKEGALLLAKKALDFSD